jgi:MerR family transcriptional regulator, thiopeptide resistance regulator
MKPHKLAIYRVQDLARMTGVTVRALRYYDRLGLLRPARHQTNGYRLYTGNPGFHPAGA